MPALNPLFFGVTLRSDLEVLVPFEVLKICSKMRAGAGLLGSSELVTSPHPCTEHAPNQEHFLVGPNVPTLHCRIHEGVSNSGSLKRDLKCSFQA